MSSRTEAQKEARFMKGQTGVDGASSSDAPDVDETVLLKAREAMLRGRTWLGREALTWLLWKSESTEALCQFEKQPLRVVFLGKLGLRAAGGDITEMTLKGVNVSYSQLTRQAIAKGLLVHTAHVKIEWGERVFECSLDAEHFDVKSAKLPELMKEDEAEKLSERLELVGQLSACVDALVKNFVAVRAVNAAWKKDVAEMQAWAKAKK